MEALRSLEDKWNLSTDKVIALFACTSFLLIGACIAAVRLRRRKSRGWTNVHQEPCTDTVNMAEAPPRLGVAKALMGSVRWSRGSQREGPTPLLVKRDDGGGDVGWQSHNSASAVWQKPILMGGKCELPRFSGLIMYDQKGMPLHQCEEGTIHKQDNATPVVRTTLRDLL